MTTRSVPGGRSRSACQTIAGSRPEMSRSARAMSRSRLIPGKTSTADFIAIPVRQHSCRHLDPVILDYGVGEEFFRGGLERGLGAGAVSAFDLDIEDLALAHAGDSAHAERSQRPLDGLALRVEDAGFQSDRDTGSHNLFNKYESQGLQPVARLGHSESRGRRTAETMSRISLTLNSATAATQ